MMYVQVTTNWSAVTQHEEAPYSQISLKVTSSSTTSPASGEPFKRFAKVEPQKEAIWLSVSEE